jgi:pimeloyl-ACP methyl ester carboxylesterase
VSDAADTALERGAGAEGAAPDVGPRAVTYPYKRIERPPPTAADGPDPYGNPDPEWLRIDWNEYLRTVEVAGSSVNYVELGSGPPVVFVHGLSGSWQNWLENLPHFAAAGYRAIALDLPGFGASPMPEWEITIPAYGRLVDEFCRLLNLHSTALVGNSMGGLIAAETAIDEPRWIDHLVLVSAAGISHARLRRRPVAAGTPAIRMVNSLMLRLSRAALRRPAIRRAAFGGTFRHPDAIRPELLYEFAVPKASAPGALPATVALAGYDFLDRLERIAVPTLLIWGRDDVVVPASDAPGYRERISGAQLHVFEDCGHAPMAERPVRFNRLVESFVAPDRTS